MFIAYYIFYIFFPQYTNIAVCIRSEKMHLFVHTKLIQIKQFIGSNSFSGNPTNSSAGWIRPIFNGKRAHIFKRFMFHWYVRLAYQKVQFAHLEKNSRMLHHVKKVPLFVEHLFAAAFPGTKHHLDQLFPSRTVWEFQTWRTHLVTSLCSGPKNSF